MSNNKFNVIPETAFNDLILGAGILLKNFNPNTGGFTFADIVCATSGGVKTACTPKFIDLADGAENIRPGLAKFKMVDSWDASMTFTSLNAAVEGLRLALGPADLDGDYKVTLAVNTYITDYLKDIWWVGARGDDGIVAMQLKNALSENGLEISTEDNGKGRHKVTLKSQRIMGDKDVPMEFYSGHPGRLNLEDEITHELYSVWVENGDMLYAKINYIANARKLNLKDQITNMTYSINVKNGNMLYRENPLVEGKDYYHLIDDKTGKIFRVGVSNRNLYYGKENDNG